MDEEMRREQNLKAEAAIRDLALNMARTAKSADLAEEAKKKIDSAITPAHHL